jgi:hypothetical protein
MGKAMAKREGVAQATGQQVCHKQVRNVAMAAAGQLYESMMSNNHFNEEWKRQNPDLDGKKLEKRFIEQNWMRCLDFARATLALMLTKDEVSEVMKEEIMDILEKDFSIRHKYVAEPPLRRLH